ncbi:MAG: DUF1905 domain-containing protein [Phycisphaeraceae bacterium]|nr:DUF1905 domain-containing protein [Phycisphaeraceae bacterium]
MATRTSKSSAVTSPIRFSTKLLRPKPDNGIRPAWSFLVLPKQATSKLPSRSQVSVRGTFNSIPFASTLQPDGRGGHWLKVDPKLSKRARTKIGDEVSLEITPLAPDQEPEPEVPPDFRKALAAAPKEAQLAWKEITPVARRDWIQFMTSGKRAETRTLRIEKACDMLANGKRRPCCFDRSGMYDKSLSCPVPE